MLHFSVKFLDERFCPFFKKNFQLLIHIASCKTTIPSIVPRAAQRFYDEVGINWWCTPPESPDLNPIENLWHELKDHLCGVIKPKNKQELIDGILSFWSTVDEHKCCKYIRHLRKVIRKVVEKGGDATGYWTLCEIGVDVVFIKCMLTVCCTCFFSILY